jgi:hypothetical protein
MSNAAWKRLLVHVAGIAALAVAPSALAAPCIGFTDVEDTDGFCANVEWIKNRAVTLGCTSNTLYCPANSVTRLQMAAFMNRLGTALTPTQLPVDVAPGAIDLDGNAVVCQTAPFAVSGFPRRAYVDVSFSGQAAADVGLAADIVMSDDGGATWTNLNTVSNRGFVRANQWGAFADIGFVDLAVGESVRWGVRTTRAGLAGTASLADSRCRLRVLVYSRNGSASPL